MASLCKHFRKFILYPEHYLSRFYCTNALASSKQTERVYSVAKRTSENNPSHHTLEQLGLFYTIPTKTADSLFKLGGFPKTFRANINTFGETCLMIRSPAVEIISFLEKTDYNKPVVRYVLYGKPGCGKSLTLAHLVHYAFINDFIILHVPWVWDWFRNERHEVVYSANHEGCVDLPLISALWLKHFQLQNNKILNELELPIKKAYIWNQRESTPAGSHLLDLVSHGINRVKYAADCVMAIIAELKVFSKEKRCKIFVAVDGFNAFFGDHTNLKTPDRTKVLPTMVTLTKAFLEITKQDWNNGAVVVTVDQMAANFNTLHSHLPLFLLGKSGFEYINPFLPISVNEYTDMELNSMLDYYEDRRWLQNTNGRHELAFLTNKNPYQLMTICGPY
ncbi:mitochondrial ribosomal protein S29 [Rhodnius prolixus]|uniref:Small ribosomal subunit protein mS29 n=3 Tax=Rhodnius TaxID=13248 RepID=R4FMD2_RHOPR